MTKLGLHLIPRCFAQFEGLHLGKQPLSPLAKNVLLDLAGQPYEYQQAACAQQRNQYSVSDRAKSAHVKLDTDNHGCVPKPHWLQKRQW